MADPVPQNPAPAPVPAPAPASLPLSKLVAIVAAAVLSTLVAAGGLGAGAAYWWLHVPKPTPPAIAVPHDVTAQTGRIVTIAAQTRGKKVTWRSIAGPDTPDLLIHDAREVHFVAPVVGDYRLLATAVLNEEPVSDECTVHVGPYVPGPGPGPVPPGPTPVPEPPAPLPGDGLRVLMLYDPASLGKLPKEQEAVLKSVPIQQYLTAHCAKGPDGKTAEWRIWNVDVDASNESDTWKAAMARKHDKLPWLLISAGKAGGYEGPLPATVEDTLSLLKKYGN